MIFATAKANNICIKTEHLVYASISKILIFKYVRIGTYFRSSS